MMRHLFLFAMLPAALAVSGCNTGLGEHSPGLTATYNQSNSRAAFDRVRKPNPNCKNHNHFDDCDVQTDVLKHVSAR